MNPLEQARPMTPLTEGPAAVVQDPVFLAYAALGLAMLLGSGALIALLSLRNGGSPKLAAVRKTYRSWWIMIPAALLALALGRTAVVIGVGLLALFGVREFALATGLHRDRWMTGIAYLGVVAAAVVTWMPDPRLAVPGWYGLFMALPVYVVGMILILPILRDRPRGQLQQICLAVLAFIYLGWMFGHLGFLANAPQGLGYLLFLCTAVIAVDVGAFTFGRLFGRHPLRARISPNKTVEGTLGALAVGLALPFLLRFSLPGFGLGQLLLAGLIVGVGAQLGDLAISTIKRDLDMKDMGSAIPGHGGVLDRLDSLIFVAPLFFHMVRWTEGIA